MQDIYYFIKLVSGTAGLAYMVSTSTLFDPVREKFLPTFNSLKKIVISGRKKNFRWYWIGIKFLIYKLLTCALCCGFWAGMLMYFLMMVPQLEFFIWGCIGSIWTWIIYRYLHS